jgi:uncharacterized protein (TIGR02421 family)
MKTKKDKTPKLITDSLIQDIVGRIRENKQVRRSLPEGGRINIDRQVPFLMVYRRPIDHWDEGTERFVLGEASYLICSSNPQWKTSYEKLLRAVAGELSRIFGALLILEIWAGPDLHYPGKKPPLPTPDFKIHLHKSETQRPYTEALEAALKDTGISHQTSMVCRVEGSDCPSPMKPLLHPKELKERNIHLLGLEISPIFRNAETRRQFPLWRHSLHKQLSAAFHKTFFAFTNSQTKSRPPSFQALGKRAMVKGVWEIDRRLAEISDSFDLLLYLNPLNAQQARLDFKRSRYEKAPYLIYPPLEVYPAQLKRKLYAIPITRVEDPVILEILHEKRLELDIELTLLLERGTKRFFYGSLQIFGLVEKELYDQAQEILRRFPKQTNEGKKTGFVNGEEFAVYAKQAMEAYHRELKTFRPSYEVHDGISSLMVSQGRLLIGRQMKIPKPRVQPLIHHEIGTHMVTYYNALTQPFRLLHSGFSGYDETQEGLAVLAEYLCKGLTIGRVRLLAARVVAARRLIEGADFVEVYRELTRELDFSSETAFTTTLRVFRGGGLTKDAMYLRGFANLFHYLNQGGDLEPLFVGKFSLQHVEIIKELLQRKVLHKAPLTPYYLKEPIAQKRLQEIRSGLSFFDLIRRQH